MKERLFAFAWRAAILTLPWQVRWFRDAELAGWPWEQGRASFYISWFFLFSTIVLGLFVRHHPTSVRRMRFPVLLIALFSVVTFVGAGTDARAFAASAQWWAQASILLLFVVTLLRSSVPVRALAVWFAISLVPHAFLGAWQYAEQRVWGHAWLGMATQLPEWPGVSVVEHGEFRVLRVYGGFPHPNIFGGWLAAGLVVATWLASTAASKRPALGWSAAAALFSVVLLLTYARGAWIAAAVGIASLFFGLLAKPTADRPPDGWSFAFVALFVSLLSVAIVGFSQADHVFARFDPTARLEAKSVDVRAQSLRDGIRLFREHPFVGTGPNAALLALHRIQGAPERSSAPLEPPHNAFLVAAVDVGAAGIALLAAAAFVIWRTSRGTKRSALFLPLLSVAFVVAMFDHYPWTLWAGQSLVALAALMALRPRETSAP